MILTLIFAIVVLAIFFFALWCIVDGDFLPIRLAGFGLLVLAGLLFAFFVASPMMKFSRTIGSGGKVTTTTTR